MADKKESDTLRQRRHAQQEFLRLKKMQSGELDAGPKPSEVAAPLTFTELLRVLGLAATVIPADAIRKLCGQVRQDEELPIEETKKAVPL